MTSQPGNKQLQYTYCPIFHEAKVTDNVIWTANSRIKCDKDFSPD